MKKKYESPMAEKYEFKYVENVVASDNSWTAKDGKSGHAANSCHTGNTADVSSGCIADNDKQAKKC